MAKKKPKKCDFSKVKENVSKFFFFFIKILKKIIAISSLITFFVVPFLHNQIDGVVAKCVWYPSLALFILCSVVYMRKKAKESSPKRLLDYLENMSIIPLTIALGSVFIINYYDTRYTWYWGAYVWFVITIPTTIIMIYKFLKDNNVHTINEMNIMKVSCAKYAVFYFLIDVFVFAIINYWTSGETKQDVWLVLQVVFGGIAMLFVFVNLTKSFLSNDKKHMWLMLQDFVFGVVITIYLIYLIPDSSLQSIVLTIVASIYGGLLTLVGVAWTIKDNAEKLKQERKLSIKPYLEVFHDHYSKLDELPRADTIYVNVGKYLTWQNSLPEEIKPLCLSSEERTNNLELAARNMLLTSFMSSHYLVSCQIVNCGAGNAIDLKIKINDFELTPMCVTNSSSKRIVLIISDELLINKLEDCIISISYTYSDVACIGKYQQIESFIFNRSKSGDLQTVQLKDNLLTSPKEI